MMLRMLFVRVCTMRKVHCIVDVLLAAYDTEP